MCVGLSLGKSTPRIRGMADSPRLTLALLVARVGADHVQLPLPLYQLAVLADPFDTGPYFHDCFPIAPVRWKMAEILSVANVGNAARGNGPDSRLVGRPS